MEVTLTSTVYSPETGYDDCYTITYTWTAEDNCGNTETCDQVVTVYDDVKPEFENLPSGSDLGCNPLTLPSCDTGVLATDNCDEMGEVTCTPGPIVEDG
ncbi:MAG TPA: hypothetical protein PKM87_09540 [Methanolinea sp.]|nr:hypothetical protein [Methanolinea sp.]